MTKNPAIPRRYKGEGKTAYRLRLEKRHADIMEYLEPENAKRFSTLQVRSFRATANSLQGEINKLLKPGAK